MLDDILLQLMLYLDWCTVEVIGLDYAGLFAFLASFLFIDSPRYIISKFLLVTVDISKEIALRVFPMSPRELSERRTAEENYVPSISALCPGKNEEETIAGTIDALLAQNYPKLEVLAVDDASTDGTWETLRRFNGNPNVRLYRKEVSGGKASASNMALSLAEAGEIIVVVDADSTYEPDAIRELVKPFLDPTVGAVAGNLRVTNWDKNFITRFQAADYIHSISLGRRLQSMFGVLSVCSGAFAAFRREAVDSVRGWDIGPGEDGDMTVKIRKLGYKVVFAPNAVCKTKVPETWGAWWRQRRRWGRAAMRYKMRKHLDMANPTSDSYSLGNFLVIMDAFFFRIFLLYSFWIYFSFILLFRPELIPLLVIFGFLFSFVDGALQLCVQLYYSRYPKEDFEILLYSLIIFPYRVAEKTCRVISITEEFLLRRSYYESRYIPKHVRDAIIQW